MAAPMRLGVADHARLLPVLVREGLIGVLDALHRRHGPVVDFGYGSNRMVVVFGPEANEHILSTHADAFEWGEAMQALVAVDGPTALVVSDGDDHKRRRRLVQPAFSIKRVDAHLGLVVTEIDRALAEWEPGTRLDAADSMMGAIRRIVVRALFGEALGAEADRFGELLEPGLDYVQKMPQQRFEHDLRLNPYAKVQRRNREADALVLAEVARRRAAGPITDDPGANGSPDTLTALLAGVEGETLSDAELVERLRHLRTLAKEMSLDAESAAFRSCAATDDFRLGVDAFFARKPATFTGR